MRGLALGGEFAEEFLLVHAVLEGLAAINEDDRDLIVELAAKVRVGVNVNLAPGASATAGELRKTLLDHFAQVATLAGIDDDTAGRWHAKKDSIAIV